MKPSLRQLALALLLPLVTSGAHAAIQDFANGRLVGKNVLPIKLNYFAEPASLDKTVLLIDFCAPVSKLNKKEREAVETMFAGAPPMHDVKRRTRAPASAKVKTQDAKR